MKRAYLAFLVCVFLILPSAIAKKLPPEEEWNSGTLVLKNNEVVKGKIYYNQEYDLVQVKDEDKIRTFTPFNVQYFQFYDEAREIKRLYAALENRKGKNNRKGYTFYEVLLDGSLVLLRKEVSHVIPEYEILYNTIDLVPSMSSNHYVLIEDQLVAYNNFQQDVMPLMQDHAREIENYILDQQYDILDFVDQILIIDYYNFLKNPLYKILNKEILVKE